MLTGQHAPTSAGPAAGPDRSASSPAGAGQHVTGWFFPPGRRPGPGGPVVHGLGQRVGSRCLQPSVRLGLELLELVADLGLGAPGDLAPDTRPVRAPAERDGADSGAVRRIPVNRTFAVPRRAGVAIARRVAPSLALGLSLLRGLQDRIWPLTCGAKGTRTPGLLDANQTLFQLSYSPASSFRPEYPLPPVSADPPGPVPASSAGDEHRKVTSADGTGGGRRAACRRSGT